MKRLIFAVIIIFCYGCLGQSAPPQQNSADFETRRKQADTVYQLGRASEALPLYGQLVQEKPDDAVLRERYGMSMLMASATVADVEQRKKMRAQGRQMLIKARELGDTSSLMLLINDIPEDGGVLTFSSQDDANSAMEQGESAYSKGDYDGAIKFYQKGLALDPKNYHAALFIGDSNFASGRFDEAGQWFAQAIAINPNVETAYRYWGDALVKQQKWEQAKSKFLDAIVAEPYNQHSWAGLMQWANLRGMKLVKPNIVPPSKVEEKDAKHTNITLNIGTGNKQDGTSAWFIYPIVQVAWKNEGEFLKKHPQEKQYRHSLDEEVAAFSGVLASIDVQVKDKTITQLDPQLQKLLELRDRGFLEPYILIHRADEGIAQDYPAYREAHRDKIRDYLEYCVVPQ